VEGAHEGAGDATGGGVMPGVEGRLPAADLSPREFHLEASFSQESRGVDNRLRHDEIAETGGEELDRRHAPRV